MKNENTGEILIVGDLHGNAEQLMELIHIRRPAIILQVGDAGYWPGTEKSLFDNLQIPDWCEMYFVDGNHENHEMLRNFNTPPSNEIIRRCWWMPTGSVIYNVNDTYNILFVGGARSFDRLHRIVGRDWFKEETPNYAECDLALSRDVDKINLVISHTCPNLFNTAQLGVAQKERDVTRDLLDAVLQRYTPEWWYFGHWHDYENNIYTHEDGSLTQWTCLANVEQGHNNIWWEVLNKMPSHSYGV